MSIKLSCSTVVFREYSLEQALYAIRQAGYEYVETQSAAPFCPHTDVFGDDPAIFADRVKAAGFSGVTALKMPGASLLTNDRFTENGIRAVEWAAAAGIGVVVTCEGNKPETMPNKSALSIMRRRLEPVLEKAARWGVYLAFEPGGSFSLTAGGMKQLLGLVDSPWAGVCFDPADIRRAGVAENKSGISEHNGGECEMLGETAERVVHFHAGDVGDNRNYVPLGEGSVRLAECLRILRRCDYIGAVSLETDGDSDFETASATAKTSFKWLCDNIADENADE